MVVATSFATTCYEQCFNYFIKDQYGFPPSYNGLLKAAVGIIAFILAIVGALNWLLIGVFRFDLVAFLFGNMTLLSRIVYILVGLCGLYLITFYGRINDRRD